MTVGIELGDEELGGAAAGPRGARERADQRRVRIVRADAKAERAVCFEDVGAVDAPLASDICAGDLRELLIHDGLLHAELAARGLQQDVAVRGFLHRICAREFETQRREVGAGSDAQVVFDAFVVAVEDDADARGRVCSADFSEMRDMRAPVARIVAEEVVGLAAELFSALPCQVGCVGEAH